MNEDKIKEILDKYQEAQRVALNGVGVDLTIDTEFLAKQIADLYKPKLLDNSMLVEAQALLEKVKVLEGKCKPPGEVLLSDEEDMKDYSANKDGI